MMELLTSHDSNGTSTDRTTTGAELLAIAACGVRREWTKMVVDKRDAEDCWAERTSLATCMKLTDSKRRSASDERCNRTHPPMR